MNNSRVLANNISLELNKKSMDLEEFGEKIGFSFADVNKLVEGRLFIPPFLVTRIASILGISKEKLLENRGMAEYNSLIHNFRDFKNESNQELVLDLIDMYADLAESM